MSTAFQGDDNLSHVLYTGTREQWNALMNEPLMEDSPALVNATLHCEAVGDEVSDVQMNCTTIRFYCSICGKYETVNRSASNHTYEDGVCTVCGHEGYWDYVVDEATGTVTITAYLGTDTDVVIPDKIEGLLTVLWFHSEDVVTDGVVYEMTFQVLETATDATVDITIDYLENGNANLEGENVIFDPINGAVETMTYYLGDLNSDGQVTMVDLLKLAQYVAQFEIELTEKEHLAADVTGDGAIDIHDVLLLNQWLLEENA